MFNIIFRILFSIGAVWNAFLAVTGLFLPETVTLLEVGESALWAALFTVFFIDTFRPLSLRLTYTLGAVTALYSAAIPDYSILTAVIAALGGVLAFLAIIVWRLPADAVDSMNGRNTPEDESDDELWLRPDVAEAYRERLETDPDLSLRQFLEETHGRK